MSTALLRWTCARAVRVQAQLPTLTFFARRHRSMNPTSSNAVRAALQHQRASLFIPPVERLTRPVNSPQLSDVYAGAADAHDSVTQAARAEEAGGGHGGGAETQPFRFAVKNSERGLLEHGVTPEALDFIAEAEAAYQASSAYLHDLPGGPGTPESATSTDPVTGHTITTTRIAAPFGETYVPSSKERFAARQHVGELSRQHAVVDKPYMLDEHGQLNLKKERQLAELLAAPMPHLAKAEEVAHFLLESMYPQHLALQPRTGESVMLLFSQASLLKRLEAPRPSPTAVAASPRSLDPAGRSKGHLAGSNAADKLEAGAAAPAAAMSLSLPRTPHDIPFLDDMRRLYTHHKRCFSSPTPLMLEHLMTALSTVAAPSTAVFHLANRLLLDADKFVVLPTRTTYTAFFTVCQVNNAMSFAVARYTDAVQALQLPVDAPMLTALLKGLNEGGYVEEAVALLSRVQHVPVSTPLLNASLETLLLSEQALACFSLFEAVGDASVRPNAETYTLLLLACEKAHHWGRVTALLADMQRRRVRGNAQTLNLLLKGLLEERLHSFAAQLYHTMMTKNVPVWPALQAGVQPLLKR